MLYHAHEMQKSWLSSASAWASIGAEMLTNPVNPFAYSGMGPAAASALEVFAHAAAPRGKPAFGIDSVEVEGTQHQVVESIVLNRDFGDLVRFTHDALPEDAPRVLLVAPMSGHFATLLRGTVERLVQTCEVYITDWHDAKQVPTEAGRFDLDDYIDYLIAYLEFIHENGTGTGGLHMVAVCQPSVPALAATAYMNARENPARPKTLTMMGGPIDTRQSPTSVNDLAMDRPLSWFRQNVIATVPMQYRGAGRRVYPGFMQLAGFMTMNLGNHILSHYEMFKHLTEGDNESAQATKDFYEEYRSVCDMTAEFYLQTVEEVFQKHSLPKGEFTHRGQIVDLGAITDTAILAVEGERDDISGLGQTKAALNLATGLSPEKKQYLMAEGAGHYGIFNGSRWRSKVAPVLEEFFAAHA
ncbi:polyhydroxyalkanoate depolymerase [Altererythrobacter aurantiacus]|uniref:Polyhydroxyalkanoate depolymerase n=1 Tax=Parapontixanthobacter aurantiacus TaxID=1463599 RepID=A0A844ZM15_9SPHN|nr:polyhydroxyalkanoate depolymerase [Parapontixanthobacter aurantiacus]MXO86709.1 polyhydroxyalkanoate depolymerase [Parapontixanthobacter aurantiacus]